MNARPLLYTLEAHPARITVLHARTGAVVSCIDAQWGTPDGIWVDTDAGKITWTNMGADYDAADGTIERADLNGTRHEVLIGDGKLVTPKQLAVDREAGWLYWCDREGMRIMRARLDGSEVETLLVRGAYPQDRPDESRHCVGIALDLKARQIYWTQKGSPKGGIGRIFRMPLDLPQGVDPALRDDITLLADHLPEPIDLHVSQDSTRLFWTDRGAPPDGNSLNVAHIDESGLHAHKVLLRGLDEGIGLALDKEEKEVFISDLGGTIRVFDLKHETCRILRQQAPTTGIYLVD
ncbi:hypothetical protein [Asaia sp. VD9]|uniref:YncE family protein n=1 Tax=Asaia sp. VD9 TaxID=3081235 RepID=UPI003015FE7A